MPYIPRRRLLQSAVASSALALATPGLRGQSPSNRLRIACIGTGGRTRHLLKSLVDLEGVSIDGLCDVRQDALDETLKQLNRSVPTTTDYRAVLDRQDIDAVLIGTADHWHVPLTIAACQANKHIYVEKPMTHEASEGAAALAAAAASRSVIQVGMQQRSMPHIAEAAARIREGELGQIVKVHMSWNRNADRVRRFKGSLDPKTVDWKGFLGNAPDQPYDEYRMRNWRWFWDFGGGIFTDLMVHWVDVAHWVLNLRTPERAASLGQFVSAEGIWETPDTVQTVMSYPGGIQMHFEGTFANARGGAGITFMGTEGSLQIDRGGYVLTFEPKTKKPPQEKILGTGPRFADFYDAPDGERLHLQNWIDAIRHGTPTTAPLQAGIDSAGAAHLANRSLREHTIATAS